MSLFSLSEVRSCRAVWTVTLLHLLLCLWLQHSVRVLLTVNLQAFVAVGGLFLLLIFMSSWNLVGILHWKWVTYCSVFMGHIVLKWDGGCYLIPSSPDVCPSPLGSSQAVQPFVRLNCFACNEPFMLSVTQWWQRSCRRITAAEYCCVLTMKTRSLPKHREPLPRRPNSWKPLLWKPQAVMVASEVWVCGLSDVNTLRVPDTLRSDVSVLGNIRFISRVSLKGETFEVTTHVRTGLLTS